MIIMNRVPTYVKLNFPPETFKKNINTKLIKKSVHKTGKQVVDTWRRKGGNICFSTSMKLTVPR